MFLTTNTRVIAETSQAARERRLSRCTGTDHDDFPSIPYAVAGGTDHALNPNEVERQALTDGSMSAPRAREG